MNPVASRPKITPDNSPLLARLDVAPEARAVLNSLIDAANDAEVDARHELENEIRAGRLC